MAAEEECPLCMEEMKYLDQDFCPCSCTYKVCGYCWYRILLSSCPKCPGCRQPYCPTILAQQLSLTWVAEVERIRAHEDVVVGATAFKILKLLAYFKPGIDVQNEIFKGVNPTEGVVSKALELLASESHIHSLNESTFQILEVIQIRIRRFVDESTVLAECMQFFWDILESGSPHHQTILHATAAWYAVLKHDPLTKHYVNFLTLVSEKLDSSGQYQEFFNISVISLPRIRALFGPVDVKSLRNETDVATALWRLDRLEESFQLFSKLLPQVQTNLGFHHWLTLNIHNEMAFVRTRQGKCAEAAEMVEELCRVTEVKYGEAHPDTLTTYRNKGAVLRDMEQFDASFRAFQHVYDVQMNKLGAAHPDTLAARFSVASILGTQGKYEDALFHHSEVLRQRKETLEPKNPDLVDSICETAFTLNKLLRYSEALDMCQSGLQAFDPNDLSISILRLHCQSAKALIGLKRREEGMALFHFTRQKKNELMRDRNYCDM